MILHLGDQIYTLERGSDQRAMGELAGINNDGVSATLRDAMWTRAVGQLQYRYRKTWGQVEKAIALANTSNLMIWSDNDVGNNFTVVYNKEGKQKFPAPYLSVGMDCYRIYQRSLWDPGCFERKAEEPLWDPGSFERKAGQPAVEEWYYKQYGPFGILMLDMRGNRVTPEGALREGLPPILSDRQKEFIRGAFSSEGLSCMVVCAEIPFVGADPSKVKEQAEKIVLLKNHWVHEIEDCIWMLDLCFEWKAAVPGRELIMLTGDLHIGVDSTITDSKTGLSVRHITASPITNEVSPFHTEEKGSLNERYSFVSKPIRKQRNFCVVNLELRDGVAKADLEWVCVPIYIPPKYEMPDFSFFGFPPAGFLGGGGGGGKPKEGKATTTAFCAVGCGRKAAEGFPTCCRTCAATGGLEHGPACNEAYKKQLKAEKEASGAGSKKLAAIPSAGELKVGDSVRVPDRGTASVVEMTTTDVQLRFGDGSKKWYDVEDVATMMSEKISSFGFKIGDKLEVPGKGKAVVVEATTTDVQLKCEDGGTSWHDVEDLTKLLQKSISHQLRRGDIVQVPGKGEAKVLEVLTADMQVEFADGSRVWYGVEDFESCFKDAK